MAGTLRTNCGRASALPLRLLLSRVQRSIIRSADHTSAAPPDAKRLGHTDVSAEHHPGPAPMSLHANSMCPYLCCRCLFFLLALLLLCLFLLLLLRLGLLRGGLPAALGCGLGWFRLVLRLCRLGLRLRLRLRLSQLTQLYGRLSCTEGVCNDGVLGTSKGITKAPGSAMPKKRG